MKYQKIFRAVVVILLFTISLTTASDTFAVHKYHTSLTRMDYNAEDKLIEITIQLFTHDLVPVLEKQQKSRIDLEKTPDIDKILLAYLNEKFILKDEKESVKTLNWVGKEIKVDLAYIYVEIPFEGSFENLKLNNSIFFESFAEQTNLVVFRFNDKKADLFYKVGDKFKEIKFVET